MSGSVNFATVAYRTNHIETGKSNFVNWNNTGSLKSYFKNRDNYYTTIDENGNEVFKEFWTVKGMGSTTGTITTKPLEYFIDDTVGDGILPVKVTNQFFDSQIRNYFTTNISPFTANNRRTTPISNVVSIAQNGPGMKNDRTIINSPHSEGWIFDSLHCRYVSDWPVNPVVAKDEYAGKTTYESNERYNSTWLKRIASDEWALTDAEFDVENFNYLTGKQQGGYNTMCNYGIAQDIVIKIHNLGANKNRKLIYYQDANDPNRTQYKVNDGNWVDLGMKGSNGEKLMFEDVILPKNAITTITIRHTMMTSANPTVHHKFYIETI